MREISFTVIERCLGGRQWCSCHRRHTLPNKRTAHRLVTTTYREVGRDAPNIIFVILSVAAHTCICLLPELPEVELSRTSVVTLRCWAG